MCDSIYRYIEPIFNLTLYPVIAYDAFVIYRSVIGLMQRSKRQFSSVQLSVVVIIFCVAVGGLFRQQALEGFLMLAAPLVYSYPLVDYVFKKNRSHWDNFFCLPFALCALSAGAYSFNVFLRHFYIRPFN